MVSSSTIKTETSAGLTPSVVSTPTILTNAAGSIIVQMDGTNQSQTQQQPLQHHHQHQNHHHHQQQQHIVNMNKSQQIINKNSSVTNVTQHLSHNNVVGVSSNGVNVGTATTLNSPKMGSRRIFTPQFKLQVLESYRNDNDCKGNQRATARKYNIHRRQIQKWLQCESNLRSSVASINQSQVKHQFHNITPNSTVTTTQTIIAPSPHNSQFVSQQQQHHQQQQHQHYQQQLKQQHQPNLNSSLTVPSPPTSTTTPCTAAGVLVAANFAAAVAAAASVSMGNVEKHSGTATTSSLSPIRPTAIVGSGSSEDANAGNTGGSLLHSHAHLSHISHHLPPHHSHHHQHHHHLHPHAHHHHPYSTLPYTHTAVPLLTHHQPLYPHPAAAALLVAAHHHLPTHQLPSSAMLHHHHYQQQQQQQHHEYHNLHQQQLFAATAVDPSSTTYKKTLEVEVVGDADTESEADIVHNNSSYSLQTIKTPTKIGNIIEYEREQLDIENMTTKCKNGNNNNCNRLRLTAVYKLQQPQQHHSSYVLNEINGEGENIHYPIDATNNEQATITPIDLSLNGARRCNNNNNNNNHNNNHNKILMTKDETVLKYDKHVPSSAYYDVHNGNDDVVIGNHNNNNCSEETINNALVVDLTFRKRKVMSKCTISTALDIMPTTTTATATTTKAADNDASSQTNENKDDDTQPEKLPKFSAHQSNSASVSSNGVKTTTEATVENRATTTIEIKQEQMSTHDVNTTITSTTNAAKNIASKPVKLFKPYLLHEEEEEEEERHQEEVKFHLTKQNNSKNNELQQNQQYPVSSLPLSTSSQTIPTSDLLTGNTIQGVANTNNNSTFPIGSLYFQNNNGVSKPPSPKTVLCSPTSPIGFQRFSKGSPVSGYESSSSTYSECSSHRGLSHYSLDLQLRAVYSEQLGSPSQSHNSPQNHQQQLMASTQQQHFHSWLDQDTQSSLATNSSRSSPTPTPTPPTARTPPAANTSIALYA